VLQEGIGVHRRCIAPPANDDAAAGHAVAISIIVAVQEGAALHLDDDFSQVKLVRIARRPAATLSSVIFIIVFLIRVHRRPHAVQAAHAQA
jgi:hypothetical protein